MIKVRADLLDQQIRRQIERMKEAVSKLETATAEPGIDCDAVDYELIVADALIRGLKVLSLNRRNAAKGGAI